MAKKDNLGAVWTGLAVTRVLLGFIFVWAFLDKVFGLGFATPVARAWVNGGSPTTGFLKHVEGPFSAFFQSLSGSAFADWLFMLGLLGIGTALIFGIAVRLATWTGAVLMALMWAASLPLENNPLIDDHIIYGVVLLVIGAALPQQKLSVHAPWTRLGFVKNNKWLW